MKIFTPVVEHLKLQIRLNLKKRNVELKVIVTLRSLALVHIQYIIYLKSIYVMMKCSVWSHSHSMVWVSVFTLRIVLCFRIQHGQKYHTHYVILSILFNPFSFGPIDLSVYYWFRCHSKRSRFCESIHTRIWSWCKYNIIVMF